MKGKGRRMRRPFSLENSPINFLAFGYAGKLLTDLIQNNLEDMRARLGAVAFIEGQCLSSQSLCHRRRRRGCYTNCTTMTTTMKTGLDQLQEGKHRMRQFLERREFNNEGIRFGMSLKVQHKLNIERPIAMSENKEKKMK